MTTMLPPTVDDDLDTPINDPAEGTGAPRPRSRNVFKEYRPSVVTGGLPALPLLLISGFALTEQLDRSAFGVLIPEIRDYWMPKRLKETDRQA